jgi:hypothetical protein
LERTQQKIESESFLKVYILYLGISISFTLDSGNLLPGFRFAMKIQSLIQVVLALRLVGVVFATNHHVTRLGNATDAVTAAAAPVTTTASSWFPSFASIFANVAAANAPPTSSTTARSKRRRLSWVEDRWAPDQGQAQTASASDILAGGENFRANNPNVAMVSAEPTAGAEKKGDKADDDSTTNTTAANVTEVDPNLETITPWDYKNKTAFEKNNTNATTTTASAKNSIKKGNNSGDTDNSNTPPSPLPLLLPPEKEQPTSWYMSVVIIFFALALILCTVTCCRVCRNQKRRRDYEAVAY